MEFLHSGTDLIFLIDIYRLWKKHAAIRKMNDLAGCGWVACGAEPPAIERIDDDDGVSTQLRKSLNFER